MAMRLNVWNTNPIFASRSWDCEAEPGQGGKGEGHIIGSKVNKTHTHTYTQTVDAILVDNPPLQENNTWDPK